MMFSAWPGFISRIRYAKNAPENRADDQRVHTGREEADDDAGHQAFDRRSNHDADDLRAHLRREQRRQAVEDSQEAAEQRRKQRFFHRIPPADLLRVTLAIL